MQYDVAQICENGHVISSYHLSYPESSQKYCDKRGAPTILVVLTEPWQAYVQAVEANGFASSNPQQLVECHYE